MSKILCKFAHKFGKYMIDTLIRNMNDIPFEYVRTKVLQFDARSERPRKIHGFRYWRLSLNYGIHVYFDGIIPTHEISQLLSSIYKKRGYKPKFEEDFWFSAQTIYINSRQHNWDVTTGIRVMIDPELWDEELQNESFQKLIRKHT